ncbi:MAG: HNH endonuclease [Candidatus Kapabacteria bacterium]|nr:HNH endonuclease [Candidatus Kapabacteria bacterium]
MPRPRLSSRQKELIAGRARYCCEYCHSQERYSPDPFSIEHIIPKSKGGTDNVNNLAFACQGCNNRKYNHTKWVDPVSGNVVPLFHPRTDRWQEHFHWSNDFTEIIGLSDTGRATIDKLQLNRSALMNLRSLLVGVGEHPP